MLKVAGVRRAGGRGSPHLLDLPRPPRPRRSPDRRRPPASVFRRNAEGGFDEEREEPASERDGRRADADRTGSGSSPSSRLRVASRPSVLVLVRHAPRRHRRRARRSSTCGRCSSGPAIAVAAIVYGLIAWSLIALPAPPWRRRRCPGPAVPANTARWRSSTPRSPSSIVVVLFALVDPHRSTGSIAVARDPDVRCRGRGLLAGDGGSRIPDPGSRCVSEPSGEGVPGPRDRPAAREPTVRIELTSNDVIHSFWVPDFLFKRDAIPGARQRVRRDADGARHVSRQCAEFCGLNHAYMTFTVARGRRSAFDAGRIEPTGARRHEPRRPIATAPAGPPPAGRSSGSPRPTTRRSACCTASTAFGFFLVGGALAGVMRTELAEHRTPDRDGAGVQRAVHDPRHSDDLPVRGAVRRRARELPRARCRSALPTWRSRA